MKELAVIECSFRVTRGSWYLGPCRLPMDHAGPHHPLSWLEREQLRQELERRGLVAEVPLSPRAD